METTQYQQNETSQNKKIVICFVYQLGLDCYSFYLDDVNPKITIRDLLLNNISSFSFINASNYFRQEERNIEKNFSDEQLKEFKAISNKNIHSHSYVIHQRENMMKKNLQYLIYSPLSFKGKKLQNAKSLDSYDIQNYDVVEVQNYILVGGGCWDRIKNEQDLNIGFNVELALRKELLINLIHFDAKMRNCENYRYYNNFKVDVVGAFYAIDDIEIFKQYLVKIKEKNIPFIVISSGSSGKTILPICKKYSFIKEVIIFCFDYEHNKHYLKEYPGYVKKVFTSIEPLYDYLQSNKNYENEVIIKNSEIKNFFSESDLDMDNQFFQCPVISATEYDKCYFLVHRAYSHFFGNINDQNERPKFSINNYLKIVEGLMKINKLDLIQKFKNLVDISDNKTFIEKAIRTYTQEGDFCYLFNRIMRNFETGIIKFAYYMGPFLYGANKFVKEDPTFAMSKDMILYRVINCTKLDFYLYKLNIGHIICFPSLTSTSLKDNNFSPTQNNSSEFMKIKLIFKYNHKPGNISPGIIIGNRKDSKGKYLSAYPSEQEVLLFPFTFVRIIDIKNSNSNKIINLEIINRTSYIEYTLKSDVKNRILFNKLDSNFI